jgi:hypothetical protein
MFNETVFRKKLKKGMNGGAVCPERTSKEKTKLEYE